MREFRWSVAILLLAVVGCHRGDSHRVPVSGTVMLDGTPVAQGSIALRPDASFAGPAAGTDIVAGKFSIPQQRGPVVGPYLARVTVVMPPGRDDRRQTKLPKFAKVTLQTFETALEIKTDETNYKIDLP